MHGQHAGLPILVALLVVGGTLQGGKTRVVLFGMVTKKQLNQIMRVSVLCLQAVPHPDIKPMAYASSFLSGWM